MGALLPSFEGPPWSCAAAFPLPPPETGILCFCSESGPYETVTTTARALSHQSCFRNRSCRLIRFATRRGLWGVIVSPLEFRQMTFYTMSRTIEVRERESIAAFIYIQLASIQSLKGWSGQSPKAIVFRRYTLRWLTVAPLPPSAKMLLFCWRLGSESSRPFVRLSLLILWTGASHSY